MREGNLEPPKRHPLGWQTLEFYDEGALTRELERVYDVCHGCRRCFNLCNAFPTLFDLVDQSKTGELDAVDKQDFWKVVDQCYLCDMCFMTKCPYVPPHPLNVDFPHLMLRAKAVKYKSGKTGLRDKLLSSTDALGKLAAIPVVAQAVNKVNRAPAARALMEKVLGVAKERTLPEYTGHKFRGHAHPRSDVPAIDGRNCPGKVALFATCYVNYNEPGIGHDLLAILEHNDVATVLVEREVCCGMPKLELGDLDSVARLKELNIAPLAALAAQGFALVTPIPSCTLMFKQELPLMFPDDQEVRRVAQAMFDPFEYLSLRHRDGLLKTNFRNELGNVSYHVPCHLRVQNIGLRTAEVLKLVPGTRVDTVERCSGHDGTWGVKKEFFAESMKIGRPVFRAMAEHSPRYISSDCPIAGRHIKQGIGPQGQARAVHPLTLLRTAYGL